MIEPSAPGETLKEILDELGWTQTMLSQVMGRPLKTINEIIKGKVSITPETALQLEAHLQPTAEFWVTRDALYWLAVEKRKQWEMKGRKISTTKRTKRNTGPRST